MDTPNTEDKESTVALDTPITVDKARTPVMSSPNNEDERRATDTDNTDMDTPNIEDMARTPDTDMDTPNTEDKARFPPVQRSVAFDLSAPSQDKQEEKTRRVTIRQEWNVWKNV